MVFEVRVITEELGDRQVERGGYGVEHGQGWVTPTELDVGHVLLGETRPFCYLREG